MILLIAVDIDSANFLTDNNVETIKETAEIYVKNRHFAVQNHGEIFRGVRSETTGKVVSSYTVLNDIEAMFLSRSGNVLNILQLTKERQLQVLGLEFLPNVVRILKDLITH